MARSYQFGLIDPGVEARRGQRPITSFHGNNPHVAVGAAREGEANQIHVGHADLGQYLALFEVCSLPERGTNFEEGWFRLAR